MPRHPTSRAPIIARQLTPVDISGGASTIETLHTQAAVEAARRKADQEAAAKTKAVVGAFAGTPAPGQRSLLEVYTAWKAAQEAPIRRANDGATFAKMAKRLKKVEKALKKAAGQ